MTLNTTWSQCELILAMLSELFCLVLALSCQGRHLQQLDVAQSTFGKRNRSVTALTINFIIHISLSLLRTSKYLTLAHFTSVTFANTLTRLVRQPTGKTVAAICYLLSGSKEVAPNNPR
jgi:hypothetical protein